jgi:prophage maintenance system killer protein
MIIPAFDKVRNHFTKRCPATYKAIFMVFNLVNPSFTMATQRITAIFLRSLNQQVTGQTSVVVKPNELELESALARPIWKKTYNSQASAADLAASLAYDIIQGHLFMDGNRRTAFWAVNEYLKDIEASFFTAGTPGETPSGAAMGQINRAHKEVARGELNEEDLAAVYRKALGM